MLRERLLEILFEIAYAGAKYTIEKRADGKLQMKSSKEPNTTRIVTVDMFLRDIGF